MSNSPIIKVENVSKVYTAKGIHSLGSVDVENQLWALKEISFEVNEGDSIGIIGANGSGKSTLLKILAGVTPPSDGRIEINGRVASILDIGAGFHQELSGADNIYLNGQILGFSKKEIHGKFDEIVDFSGIEKFINEPVKNYSNGMYLRLAFSIMVHLDFDIYLLDEVLNVGDVAFRNKVSNKIIELKEKGVSILFVSHENSQLVNTCKRGILLDKGKLIKSGALPDVVSSYYDQTSQESTSSKKSSSNYIESVVDLNNIRCINDEGQTTDCFSRNENITVELEFTLKTTEKIDIGIAISDITNNYILGCGTNDLEKGAICEVGNYFFKYTIPSNLLNSGDFHTNIFILNKSIVVKSFLTYSRFGIQSVNRDDIFYTPLKPILNPVLNFKNSK